MSGSNVATSPNLKNAEIQALFPEQVKSGNPFVYFISEPSEGSDGELYQQMYIAQRRNVGGNTNEVASMFLGWATGRVYRAIQNAKPEIIADREIAVGTELTGLNIQVEHKFEPKYATQSPRVYPDTHPNAGERITSGGRPTYEWATLVVGNPKDSLKTSDSPEAVTVSVDQVSEDSSALFLED